MKIIRLIIFTLFFQQASFAQNRYYTIEQIKDTLIKYKNPYAGFSKLKLYKIPVNEFRKDSFLMKKANDLLNLAFIKDLCYQRKKNTVLNWYDEYNKKGFIIKYINKSKKISYSKSKLFYDSIADNEKLLNKYFNEALKEEIKKDSIECYSEDEKMTFHYYITFHSKLMTQTGYDTIRSYYDKYYKNFNADKYFGGGKYDAVIIALINMGDPELRAKYDAWFDKKIKIRFTWNNFTFLSNNITGAYLYEKFIVLLNLNSSFIDSQIKGYVMSWYMPFDNIYRDKIEEYNIIADKFTFENLKDYKILYPFYSDYIIHLNNKEKVLFNKIKYKTKNN